MRRLFLAVLALLLTFVLVLMPSTSSATPGCVITAGGLKVCGELLGQPLPAVITVTVTPDPVTLPGPTSTTTVHPPPVTVTLPGPVTTTTAMETPQPQIVTVTPDAVPPVTQTTTIDNPSTGQPTPSHGTIGTNESKDIPAIDFGDGHTTIIEAGLGFLTLLALVGLLLLSLYAGYILGYRDRERKETDFMRALLDKIKSR